MDVLEVSTTINRAPEPIFSLLNDVTAYPKYTQYLQSVRPIDQHEPETSTGSKPTDYDVNMEYEFVFSWWRLEYTTVSRVTNVEPPNRIDWELRSDLNATGSWTVEAVTNTADSEQSLVTLRIEYDPTSLNTANINLPGLFSFDWLVDTVHPLIKREAEHIFERVVADLEGKSRPVTLDFRTETG